MRQDGIVLAMRVARKLNSTGVVDALTDLFILRGPPAVIRPDNGPGFVAQKVRDWTAAVGAMTTFIEPGSPPGRMDTARASMPGSAMSYSMAKSSTASGKHRSSSRIGASINIRDGRIRRSAAARRHPPPPPCTLDGAVNMQ